MKLTSWLHYLWKVPLCGLRFIIGFIPSGQLVRDDAIWTRWESGFGGLAEEVLQYKDNLLQLKGIFVDYGTLDENRWIPRGSVYYGEQLSAAGILVKVEGYHGNHSGRIGTRIREYMLPFFSELLKFE